MAVVTQIQLRRDTAANWTSTNPTLASGEMGFETDTGLFKIGTGATAWTSLSYAVSVTTTNTATLTNKTLTAPIITYSVNAQTGTTFTPVLSDGGSIVTLSNASAISATIPTNASVAYPIGTQLNFIQIGAGQVTISAVTSGTTTIASTGAVPASPKLRAQYSSASCIKVATDTWYVVGDIA
jgi:hypothetical protein